MVYHILYWLHKQSRLFSEPEHFITTSAKTYEQALDACREHGYILVDTWEEEEK